MSKQHRYGVDVKWTGNLGSGTSSYQSYSRDHEFRAGQKPAIPGSADAAFRGDAKRWNPEDLLVASISTCHQLWYLHLCAVAGVVVSAYEDHAVGIMTEDATGAGQFVSVVLRPRVTVTAQSDANKAIELHHAAAKMCFIARSVNFPVTHEPQIERESASQPA